MPEPVEHPSADERAKDQASPEKLAKLEEELARRPEPVVGPRMLHWNVRFPGLYLLFILLNLLDLTITKIAIDHLGMNEANVLAKNVLVSHGFGGFLLYKLFLTVLVIVLAEIIARTRPGWALGLIIFGCMAIGAIVAWGTWILF